MRVTKKDILDAVLYCFMVTDTIINLRLNSDELSDEETLELQNQKTINKECYKALLKRYFKISE